MGSFESLVSKIHEDVSYLQDKDLIKYKVGLEDKITTANEPVKSTLIAELEDIKKEFQKRRIPTDVKDMFTLVYKNMYIYKGKKVIDTIPVELIQNKLGLRMQDIMRMDSDDVTNLFVKTEYPEATSWSIPAEREE